MKLRIHYGMVQLSSELANQLGVKPRCSDVYLHNGANFPGIQDKIRVLYDPDNPPATAEELEEIKHKLKGPRSIAKKATLGFSYGMGAGKLQREFRLIGVDMTWKEADAMVQAYRKLYAGVAEWNAKLEAEWKDRGGWVYNGLARPIAVSQAYVKDLVNRCLKIGTLVLVQGKSWIPIETVCPGDFVWDGTTWVKTDGPIFNGFAKVISKNNVDMTPDHDILIKDGTMKGASHVRMEQIENGARPNVGWAEVWRLCRILLHQVAKKWTNLCGGRVQAWKR